MRISYGQVRGSGYNARTRNTVSYAQGAQKGLTAKKKKNISVECPYFLWYAHIFNGMPTFSIYYPHLFSGMSLFSVVCPYFQCYVHIFSDTRIFSVVCPYFSRKSTFSVVGPYFSCMSMFSVVCPYFSSMRIFSVVCPYFSRMSIFSVVCPYFSHLSPFSVLFPYFQWYAHNLEPVSFIVWDNLSSLNQALKSLKETDTQATGKIYFYSGTN